MKDMTLMDLIMLIAGGLLIGLTFKGVQGLLIALVFGLFYRRLKAFVKGLFE